MKKEYLYNLNYNRQRRKNSIVFSVILLFMMLGLASVFFASKQYFFGGTFSLFVIIPCIAIPMTFKNNPITAEPALVIEDGYVTALGKKLKIKEVLKVTVTIELVASKLDSENKKLLNQMRTQALEDEYFGMFDILYKNEKGKYQKIYLTIEHVIDALQTMLYYGLKRYEVYFNVKKNAVKSEFDLKKANFELPSEQNEEKPTQKKKKHRDII